MVNYHGNNTPLEQIANIGNVSGGTLTVQPWEKGMLSECSKAVMNSNLGLNPQDNGEMLIINIPPLTEERRLKMVKLCKSEGEEAKISIRNNRRESIRKLKEKEKSNDQVKSSEKEIQNITDTYISIVDGKIKLKEKEIMTI
jgi:ribosome recycling factor